MTAIAARKESDQVAIKLLSDLRQAVEDACYEYTSALRGIDDEHLERMFEEMIIIRRRFSDDLGNAIDRFGSGVPYQAPVEGKPMSQLHAMWTEFRAMRCYASSRKWNSACLAPITEHSKRSTYYHSAWQR